MRRIDLEFDIGDFIYLKVSPMKGIKRFGTKGTLSPCYVGPYRILSRYCKVSNDLEFHKYLASMHLVFHVSLLEEMHLVT